MGSGAKVSGGIKIRWRLLIFLIIIVGIGYFVYNLYSGKPKDLGVRYTYDNYKTTLAKAKIKYGDNPTTGKYTDYIYKYSGKVQINTTYGQEEISAWFNYDKPSYYPIKNVQIKINQDGTMEASGNVNFVSAADFILTEEEKKYIPSFVPKEAPVYVKGTVFVKNNDVHLNPEKIVIGAISVPSKYLTKDNISYLESKIENLMRAVPNLYVEELYVKDGKVVYKGTGPTSLTIVKKP